MHIYEIYISYENITTPNLRLSLNLKTQQKFGLPPKILAYDSLLESRTRLSVLRIQNGGGARIRENVHLVQQLK